ncbi:hypothetical protein [Burkholderia plantarii]|uniref:hypothetical protein n=1 Tax=Burkholderia plantarii TaxID=41899 RepID=UPI000870B3F9|nr:hypothetical protein [Burkholderia plantarii]
MDSAARARRVDICRRGCCGAQAGAIDPVNGVPRARHAGAGGDQVAGATITPIADDCIANRHDTARDVLRRSAKAAPRAKRLRSR